MNPFYQVASAVLFMFLCTSADSETLKKAYLDAKGNVHLITEKGKHQQLTHEGNATSLKLAANNETVGWLVKNSWRPPGERTPGSEELVIHRHGKSASIKCTPFIRDYWFWQSGSQVAINCGGLHFAGREILYDTSSLREVASFDEADVPLASRPNWSNNDD
jgi:hypothetical protein